MTGDEPFRILVTASRSWRNWGKAARVLDEAAEGTDPARVVLVHGGARGGDVMAGRYARRAGWQEEVHLPDWDRFGKAAGFRRNQEMVNAGADVAVAFLMPCTADGCKRSHPHDSHGATDCAERARAAGIPVQVIRP